MCIRDRFIITEDLSPWPSSDGINVANSELLSNIVYDIAFDDTFGIIYIATMGGISIFDIPFSNSTYTAELLVSPNPYSISAGLGISISGSGNRSSIVITDLQGNVVKRFSLDKNKNKIIGWDGTDSSGNFLKTGVYIISSFNSEGVNKFGKIAIIK